MLFEMLLQGAVMVLKNMPLHEVEQQNRNGSFSSQENKPPIAK